MIQRLGRPRAGAGGSSTRAARSSGSGSRTRSPLGSGSCRIPARPSPTRSRPGIRTDSPTSSSASCRSVTRTTKLGPLHPSFEVEFKGATMLRYVGHIGDDGLRHGFAYPLQDLRGLIKFTDKAATFDRLTAMNGSLAGRGPRARSTTSAAATRPTTSTSTARGLRLDENVSAALKGSARELFNSLDADGSRGPRGRHQAQKGEPPGPRVDITVDLQGRRHRARSLPARPRRRAWSGRHHRCGTDQDREGDGASGEAARSRSGYHSGRPRRRRTSRSTSTSRSSRSTRA